MKRKIMILLMMVLTSCGVQKEKYTQPLLCKASDDIEHYILRYSFSGFMGRDKEVENYLAWNIENKFYVKEGYPIKFFSSYEIRELTRNELISNMYNPIAAGVRLAIDGNTNTYWKMEDNGVGEFILFEMNRYGPFKNSKIKIARQDGAPYLMTIYNGNPTNFYEYGRLKKVTMELYELGETVVQDEKEYTGMSIVITNSSYLIYKREFVLKDSFQKQSFELQLPDLRKVYRPDEIMMGNSEVRFGGVICILHVDEVYNGSVYSNTCLGEIKFVYE